MCINVLRLGNGPLGAWDPNFWVYKLHMTFWGRLSKAFPGLVGLPEMVQMQAKALPYRQVG